MLQKSKTNGRFQIQCARARNRKESKICPLRPFSFSNILLLTWLIHSTPAPHFFVIPSPSTLPLHSTSPKVTSLYQQASFCPCLRPAISSSSSTMWPIIHYPKSPLLSLLHKIHYLIFILKNSTSSTDSALVCLTA